MPVNIGIKWARRAGVFRPDHELGSVFPSVDTLWCPDGTLGVFYSFWYYFPAAGGRYAVRISKRRCGSRRQAWAAVDRIMKHWKMQGRWLPDWFDKA